MKKDRQNKFAFQLFDNEKRLLKSSKKLIFCINFVGDSENFYFGEENAIKKYIFDGKKEKDFDRNILFFEGITVGEFLIDSYDFVKNENFNKCVMALENMRSVADEGNDKSTSDIIALYDISQSPNIAAQLFSIYYFFTFRKEKYLSVNKNGILALPENPAQRKERFDNLYDRFKREFAILGSNPISPKNIREKGLKPQKSYKSLNGYAYFCEDLPQLYANYIDYLRTQNMFLKECESCHQIFFASNYRTKYHPKCEEEKTKANKDKSFAKYHGALWGECERERQNFKNFIKSKDFKNSDDTEKEKYIRLFTRFKEELKLKKKELNKEIENNDNLNNEELYKKRKKVDSWLKKIRDEREELE